MPWLRALSTAAVTAELQALAAADATGNNVLFRANYDPSHISDVSHDDWQGLPLMNRGQLLQPGCHLAPATCAVLVQRAANSRGPRGPTGPLLPPWHPAEDPLDLSKIYGISAIGNVSALECQDLRL